MMRIVVLMLVLFASSCRSSSSTTKAGGSEPKGWLLIVGGGGTTDDMYARAIALGGGKKSKVVVFPQASELAETGEGSAAVWRENGAGEAQVADTKDEAAALKLVDEASIIWFPGGVQARLMAALGKKLPDAIRRKYREGAVLGGTSAGAAVMSHVMLTGEVDGSSEDDGGLTFVRAQTVRTEDGLGLADWAIVDQHFLKRRRFHRLLSCVLDHPELVGVGIDERTSILVHGRGFEVVGESNVIVIDARGGEKRDTQKGLPGAGTGMKLHLLRHGMKFDADE